MNPNDHSQISGTAPKQPGLFTPHCLVMGCLKGRGLCSPSRAGTPAPAGGRRCLHRSPLGRGCPAAAPGAAHALSPGGCPHPARSRTGSAAGMGASRSSGAVRYTSINLFSFFKDSDSHASVEDY